MNRGFPARAILAALVAGAALRIVVSVASGGVAPVSDMEWYRRASWALAAGAGLPWTVDRALLYPVFLAGMAKAGIVALPAIYLVQSALTLGAAMGAGWFASRLGGRRVGWIAAALLAPQLTLAQYSGLLLSESLFLPLFVVWLALACPPFASGGRAPEPGAARMALAGIAAGCAGAAQPAALPLVLGTCLALVLVAGPRARASLAVTAGIATEPGGTGPNPGSTGARATDLSPDRGSRGAAARRLRDAGVFAAAALVALVVAVVGAARIAGTPPSWAPMAGVNLYLGNVPGGRPDGGGLSRLSDGLDAVRDPSARNAAARREALQEISHRPGRAALTCAVRLLRLLSLNPGRVEHDSLVRDGIPSPVVLAWLGLEWAILVGLCAAAWRTGAGPARGEPPASSASGTRLGAADEPAGVSRSALWFTALVAAPYVMVLTLTFVQTRFRLPLVPLLAPFAALGLARFRDARRGVARTRLIAAALCGLVVVAAATGVELVLKRL